MIKSENQINLTSTAHSAPRSGTHSALKFKGWTIPGPARQNSLQNLGQDFGQSSGIDPADVSLDGLSGTYQIFQFKKGHRYSTDDVLAAWYGTLLCPSASRILDLGTGIGSVGMMVAWKLQGAAMVGIEAQAMSVELAKRSIKHNGLSSRYEVRHGDLRDSKILHYEEKFDLITGSPPYFAESAGIVASHPQKRACRFETRGTILDYAITAQRHLAPGGVFAFVFPLSPDFQRERVWQAAKETGMTVFRYRPIILREGDAPLLGIFGMMRSDDLPQEMENFCWEEPALLIRRADGNSTDEYRCIKLTMGLPPTS